MLSSRVGPSVKIPAQSAQKHTARFEAIATELRAESAGNVRAMDLEAAVHQTHGDAPEHSETIIDASGLPTEHSEEGRPPRIPIIEVAFGKGMWSSSNGQVRFHARGMLPSRHCYRACHLRVQLC